MYFVFDLATVPDLAFLREVLEDPAEENDKLLDHAHQKLGTGSSNRLPPMYHKLVGWVGLWIENNGMPSQRSSWCGKDEREGLTSFFNMLATYKDFGLIHFNGRSFGLPLISYRAMKYELRMPARLSHYEIKYRYSDQNIDLSDELSNYSASSPPGRYHLRQLLDIPTPAKPVRQKPSKLYQEDKWDDIEIVCHIQVMSNYLVWLKLSHSSGNISGKMFENLKKRALNKLHEIK